MLKGLEEAEAVRHWLPHVTPAIELPVAELFSKLRRGQIETLGKLLPAGVEIIDFIEDDEAPPPDDTATYNLLKEHLGEVLNGLPPREVRILQLRYGLLDGQAYTLE